MSGRLGARRMILLALLAGLVGFVLRRQEIPQPGNTWPPVPKAPGPVPPPTG